MITVELSDGHGLTNSVTAWIPALRQFFARARRAVPVAGRVSVLLASDKEIRKLNREFRGKNKATDVLSFPALIIAENNSPGKRATRSGPSPQKVLAGDLAISLDTAARQAEQFGHPLFIELKILLLHGLLHLAGHDHETDGGEMAEREEQLRRRFRLPHALIARSGQHEIKEHSSARPPKPGGRR